VGELYGIPALLVKNKDLIIDAITFFAATTAIVIAYKKNAHKYVIKIYKTIIIDSWDRMTGYKQIQAELNSKHESLNMKMDQLIHAVKTNYDANVHVMTVMGNKIESITNDIKTIKDEHTFNGGSTTKGMLSRFISIIKAERNLDESAMIAIYDVDGEVTSINREFCQITGRSEDEIKGNGWVNCIALPDRDRVIRNWIAANKYKRNYEDEFSFVHVEGNTIKVISRAERLYDNEGIFFGYYAKITLKNEA